MSAVSHWKNQRRSAVLLIPLTLWLLFSVASLSRAAYLEVAAWLSEPQTLLLLALFVVIAGHHAYLGVQVVLEDYVREPLRSRAILASRLALGAITLLSLYAIYHFATGGA
jgi:succinate dehydrogenase / fumarate reductase membrane anchor subunit